MVDGAADVTLVGPADLVTALRAEVNATWLPKVSVLQHVAGHEIPEVTRELLAGRPGVGAFLCQHFSCQRRVGTVAELQELCGLTRQR